MTLRRISSLIRKTIIVVLALAAVGTGYLWVGTVVLPLLVGADSHKAPIDA